MSVQSPKSTAPRSGFLVIVVFAALFAVTALQLVPASAAQDVIWTTIAKGVEYTKIPLVGLGRPGESVRAARVDPASVLFRVYYHQGTRKTTQDWAIEVPSAVLIVNANFYRGNGRPIGLVRLGDQILSRPSGRPGSGYFQVRGEIPQVSSTSITPAASQTEPYTESFEGFPLIIADGRPIQSFASYDAYIRAWRSVVAQDDKGRILLFVSAPAELTLPDMTNWLSHSGLGIASALNLDGGASSQMYTAFGDLPAETTPGAAAVPVVLVVYPH